MKKILITGAGGYIGSVAASPFLEQGYDVGGGDNFMRGFREPLEYLQKRYDADHMSWYELDVRNVDNLAQVMEQELPEIVLHYAALCNVGESEKHPELYFDNNIQGVLGVLGAMQKLGLSKLVFSSTCSLYGEPERDTLDEQHPVRPTSHPYGESKYMCERVIDWYAKVHGFQYIFLRYFNVCGATDDGTIGDSKNPSFHLMQNAIRGALGIAEFYLNNTKVNTPDETPIRDYVNVVDLNEAHVKAVEFLLNGGISSIFNLGTGTGNSVMEIISAVEKITGKKLALREGERRSGDVSKAV